MERSKIRIFFGELQILSGWKTSQMWNHGHSEFNGKIHFAFRGAEFNRMAMLVNVSLHKALL